jgi:hypothetical protein
LYGRLTNIGELLPQFVRLGISIDLSEDVKLALLALVKAWAMHRTQGLSPFDRHLNRSDQLESTMVEAVAAILPHIPVSDDLLEAIWDKAREMDHSSYSGARAFAAYPVLAQRWPEKSSELFDRLRRALLSDQKDEVQAAVRGLYVCVNANETFSGLGDVVLNDLVREVGIAIAARRQVLLRRALGFAEWVFREGPEHMRTLIAQDCTHGLTALLEEASYARSGQTFDVPGVRAACCRLASAMVSAGFGQERGVADWLAKAKEDPLPEVRNAELRKRAEQSLA